MHDEIKRRGLHERVAHVLRQEILNAKPGLQLESMSALAKRFVVSISTARDALLLLSREGFVEIKHGMGTYVKDRSREKMVGVLCELDISHPRTSYYYRRIVQQVRSLLERQGLRVKLYLGRLSSGEEGKALTCPDFLKDVADDHLCGTIVAQAASFPEWLDLVKKHHVPCVSGLGGGCPWSVEADMMDMVQQGVRDLLQRGRRNIAVLGWQGGKFVQAIQAMLEELGAPFHDSWLREDLNSVLPGAGWEAFREIWASQAEKPDGLLICDDMLFQDVSAAILEMGIKVPDQLLVVSHANRGSNFFYPFPVVRMEFDPDLFAQAKVEMLLKLMRHEPASPPHIMLPFRWVEAESRSAGRDARHETGDTPHTTEVLRGEQEAADGFQPSAYPPDRQR